MMLDREVSTAMKRGHAGVARLPRRAREGYKVPVRVEGVLGYAGFVLAALMGCSSTGKDATDLSRTSGGAAGMPQTTAGGGGSPAAIGGRAGSSAGGASGGGAGGAVAGGAAAGSVAYATNFDATESPLSEGGHWHHTGLDWTTVNSANGIAFGTQALG